MNPWETEPDFALFTHRAITCAIIRVPHSGHLCGYIGVPEWHPWHGQDYDSIEASVHGGLTYAASDLPRTETVTGISWWIGFDCAHSGDMMPFLDNSLRFSGDTYRDLEYVKNECRYLVDQMLEAISAPS